MIAAVLPVSATLAADPMDSIYPPTPAVNVTSGQCQLTDIGVHGKQGKHDSYGIDEGRE